MVEFLVRSAEHVHCPWPHGDNGEADEHVRRFQALAKMLCVRVREAHGRNSSAIRHGRADGGSAFFPVALRPRTDRCQRQIAHIHHCVYT